MIHEDLQQLLLVCQIVVFNHFWKKPFDHFPCCDFFIWKSLANFQNFCEEHICCHLLFGQTCRDILDCLIDDIDNRLSHTIILRNINFSKHRNHFIDCFRDLLLLWALFTFLRIVLFSVQIRSNSWRKNENKDLFVLISYWLIFVFNSLQTNGHDLFDVRYLKNSWYHWIFQKLAN